MLTCSCPSSYVHIYVKNRPCHHVRVCCALFKKMEKNLWRNFGDVYR